MTQPAVTSSPAQDSDFAAFLAARPQLQPSASHRPDWCTCPVWGIGGRALIHRHGADCTHIGAGTSGRVTYVETITDADGRPQVHLRPADLDALAAWIPVPPPAPALDMAAAERAIQRMVDLGFHLIPLRSGEKINANGKGWNDPSQHPALTVEQAVAHVRSGGGLGVLLGPSRLLVIDAEDGLATAALEDAGLRPVLRTAKGSCPVECDPRRVKVGSSHFWFVLPDGVDPEQLTNSGTKHLANGGVLEILVRPGSMAVVPPTVLTEAAGWGYIPLDHPAWTGGALDPAPVWLLDTAVAAPAGLEPAGGSLLPVVAKPRGVVDEHLQAHRDVEDDVDWDSVIALAGGRLQDFGDADSCGCRILHWHTASNRISCYLHDCVGGKYAFIVSETMKLEIGLDRSTTTTVHLACLLLGRSTTGVDRERTMRELGVEPPPSPLSIEGGGHEPLGEITPDQYVAEAADVESRIAAGDLTLPGPVGPAGSPMVRVPATVTDMRAWAADRRRNAAGMARFFADRRGPAAAAGRELPVEPVVGCAVAGVTPGAHPIPGLTDGATALAAAAVVPVPASEAVLVTAAEAEAAAAAVSDDDDAVGAAAAIAARARAVLESASEPALLDKIFCTALLAGLRERSRVALVSPMVGLMADLSAVLSKIPPTTTLPPIVSKRSVFNFIHGVVGASGAGKGGATSPSFIVDYGMTEALGLGLPVVKAVGSGEAIAPLFTKVTVAEDGSKVVTQHTTSARLYWPEIAKLAAVKGRSGATIAPELCQAWSGEELGSDTKTQAGFAGAGCYRLVVTIGAQLATLALLFDPDSSLMGLSQRLWLVSALLTDTPVEGTPEWEALIDAEPWHLKLPAFRTGDVPVDADVRREVRVLRLRAQTADSPDAALETHTTLMRLRLAVAAAVLHGEPAAVTAVWWAWTGHLLEHHRRVRRAGQIAAGIARTAGAVEAGEADAIRAEAREAAQRQRAREATLRWARRQLVPFTDGTARTAAKWGSYRQEHMSGLLAELVAAKQLVGELVHVPTAGGNIVHYRAV